MRLAESHGPSAMSHFFWCLKRWKSGGKVRLRRMQDASSWTPSYAALTVNYTLRSSLLRHFVSLLPAIRPTSTLCLLRTLNIPTSLPCCNLRCWSPLTVHSFRGYSYVMSDRRRLNGPAGGRQPIHFLPPKVEAEQPRRHRQSNELRKICMRFD